MHLHSTRDIDHATADFAADGAPYVVDSGRLRSLHFNAEEIQSAMWIDRPDALYLEYTRLMMGVLMFAPQPRSITMIGLGGGSLVKFCHRHLPDAHIVAVEVDAQVLALRDQFRIPGNDARLQILQADGGEYLQAAADASCDVLMLDAYTVGGVPPALSSQAFFDECARVTGEGVLVANLHEAHPDFALQAARIRRSFGATLEVREGVRGNCVLFAGGLAFARSTRHLAVRRPQDLDREAWSQLKPVFGRILAATRDV
jgi:spermidine synthase